LPPGRACFLLGFTKIKVQDYFVSSLKIMLRKFGLQHRRTLLFPCKILIFLFQLKKKKVNIFPKEKTKKKKAYMSR